MKKLSLIMKYFKLFFINTGKILKERKYLVLLVFGSFVLLLIVGYVIGLIGVMNIDSCLEANTKINNSLGKLPVIKQVSSLISSYQTQHRKDLMDILSKDKKYLRLVLSIFS